MVQGCSGAPLRVADGDGGQVDQTWTVEVIPPPSTLEVVSGDNQSVTVTKRLAPITFRLTSMGQPVPGAEIKMAGEDGARP